jgi:hypothetical protein
VCIFFIDLFSARIEHLDSARRGLDRFREPNPHHRWRRMYFAADRRIGVLQKRMRANSRGGQKY